MSLRLKLKVVTRFDVDVSELSIFVDGREIGARFHVAHRISNGGYGLERLHGHTYEIKLNVSGNVEAGFLIPFEELMRIMLECTSQLNNKVLLPDGGGNVAKSENGSITFVSADGRRYMFPKADVAILPVGEVTAEALATYLLKEICERIRGSEKKSERISTVELTLWEGNERGVQARSSL